MNNLDQQFEELKQYSDSKSLERLNKKIYSLDMSDPYLDTLSQDDLHYVHVRLHNALSFKKPFKEISEIKKFHDRVISYLNNHQIFDTLDEK